MCRLLAFTSLERKSFSSVVGDTFPAFLALSAEHKDGWGIAYDGEILKDLDPAKDSELLSQSSSQRLSTGALLHLRQASKGISVNIDNNHPFTFESTTFMHNGTIRPITIAEQLISAKYQPLVTGTTDSERVFYAMLSQIDELGLIEGVRNTINLLRGLAVYTAMNIMVQTPDYLIAVCEFNPENQSEWSSLDHYELRFTTRGNDILVGSTGWSNSDWQHLKNHTMLVVNRATLDLSISDL